MISAGDTDASDEELVRQATSLNGVPKRIDSIFAQPRVVRARRSVDYDNERLQPGFISDHKTDMA